MSFFVNPESADEPEFTVPFVITMPEINISINNSIPVDALVGDYEDGVITITDIFVSEEFRAALAETANADESEMGCDLSEIIPMLEEQRGVPNEAPFTITKTGENAGVLKIGDDEDGGFTLAYDPASASMAAHYENEEASLDGVFKAAYNSDKTRIEVVGDMETDLGMGAENIRLTIQIKGSKPLA